MTACSKYICTDRHLSLPDHFYGWSWGQLARLHQEKTFGIAPSRQHSTLPALASLCPFHAISDLVLLAVSCHHHPLLQGLQRSIRLSEHCLRGLQHNSQIILGMLTSSTHTQATIMSYGHKAKCHALWAWPVCSRAKLALGGVT